MTQLVDLHMHTNASDGQYKPNEVVDQAITKGLKAIAITDHDTISGAELAIKYAKDKDIEVIAGIEISCLEKSDVEIHILGLFLDIKNTELNKFCENAKKQRILQKKKMITKLQDIGFDITYEEVLALTNYSFGRPHIAQILMKKYPDEFPDTKTVFDKYLGTGKPAFFQRETKVNLLEAISRIKAAGGIPILAHPGVYGKSTFELIEYFAKLGGEGIETHYPYDLINGLSKEENNQLNNSLKEYAKQHNLIESGGSDFHGDIRKSVQIGQIAVPYELVEKMKQHLSKKA